MSMAIALDDILDIREELTRPISSFTFFPGETSKCLSEDNISSDDLQYLHDQCRGLASKYAYIQMLQEAVNPESGAVMMLAQILASIVDMMALTTELAATSPTFIDEVASAADDTLSLFALDL